VSIPLTFATIFKHSFHPSVYFVGIRLSACTVGIHTYIDAYPECNNPSAGNTLFAGYQPSTDESLQVRLILLVEYSILLYLLFAHPHLLLMIAASLSAVEH
jgi:hypothetical protein